MNAGNMQVTVEQSALLPVLAFAKRMVGAGALPLLTHVKLTASHARGALTVEATDLEIACRISTDAEVTSDGSCTVEAARFYNVLQGLSGALQIRCHDGVVTMQADRSRFRFPSLDAHVFPSFMALKTPFISLSFEAPTLRALITKSEFAVVQHQVSEPRRGVQIRALANDIVRVVGFEGPRLAIVERPFYSLSKETFSHILGVRGLREAAHVLKDADRTAFLCIDDAKAVLQYRDLELAIRQVEGDFHDYSPIFSAQANALIRIDIDRDVLMDAVHRLLPFTDLAHKGIVWDIADSSLRLSVKVMHIGEGVEEPEAVVHFLKAEAKPVTIALHSKYLTEWLTRTMPKASLSIFVNAPAGICLFTTTDDPQYLYAIEPMRTW